MKLNKSTITYIVKNAPKGATHVKVTTPAGKFAISGLKQASASLDGVEGELTYGAITGKGKDSKFTPMADGKVDFAKVAEAMAKAEEPKPAKEKKVRQPKEPSLGGCGGLFGFSVTAVCRALGKAGFETADVRAIMAAKNVPIADATVGIQVNAGRNGQRGDPASLTKEQLNELRGLIPSKKDEKAEKTEAKK